MEEQAWTARAKRTEPLDRFHHGLENPQVGVVSSPEVHPCDTVANMIPSVDGLSQKASSGTGAMHPRGDATVWLSSKLPRRWTDANQACHGVSPQRAKACQTVDRRLTEARQTVALTRLV